MHISPRLSALTATAAILALAGCGSSSGTSTSTGTGSGETASQPAAGTATAASTSASTTAGAAGAGGALTLAANPEGQLKYDTTALSASAGKVSIAFTNTSPLPHNVTIANAAGSVVGATPTFAGGSKTLSVELKPGVYKFYCSVPGHREAGMEGTLTVK